MTRKAPVKRPARKKRPVLKTVAPPGTASSKVSNLITISDTHCGCTLGLHSMVPTSIDGTGWYEPSEAQQAMWAWWTEFFDDFVPKATHGEKFAIAVVGDALDGVHHRSTTQISHNVNAQKEVARPIFNDLRERCEGRLYWIRGTEAHVGSSGVYEEELAREMKAIPDENGCYARWEIWFELGNGLVHATHHIGTTGRSHYESSALMAEFAEACTEAGRWGHRPPDIVVRAHRHRHLKVEVPTSKGMGIVYTNPGWQLKTPFVHKIPGGRQSMPQFGGAVIRQGDQDLYTRHFTKSPARPEAVRL